MSATPTRAAPKAGSMEAKAASLHLFRDDRGSYLSIDCGDAKVAAEIARRWNTYGDLREACETVAGIDCYKEHDDLGRSRDEACPDVCERCACRAAVAKAEGRDA